MEEFLFVKDTRNRFENVELKVDLFGLRPPLRTLLRTVVFILMSIVEGPPMNNRTVLRTDEKKGCLKRNRHLEDYNFAVC